MYEPAEDSFLLKEVIVDYCSKNKVSNVIDMGAGSGIQGFSIVKKVDFVLLCDLDKNACSFMKKEIIEKGLSDKMEVISSDLFEDVPSRLTGKVDLIIFNAPYLPKDEEETEDTELHGGTQGIHITKNFLEQGIKFLSDKGVVFFVASSLAKLELLEEYMKNLKYNFEVVKKQHVFFEDIVVYKAWF